MCGFEREVERSSQNAFQKERQKSFTMKFAIFFKCFNGTKNTESRKLRPWTIARLRRIKSQTWSDLITRESYSSQETVYILMASDITRFPWERVFERWSSYLISPLQSGTLIRRSVKFSRKAFKHAFHKRFLLQLFNVSLKKLNWNSWFD